ncbi:Membrane-anchored protein predicted to be involved in regulation of amylopullulanase [Thiorhodovibrio winogradskyi]|uniref:Membrane-anchored protein predicted to be involved in regulation of amylopullulanase n=1 Tax=Thiorhodovibrio winogradskyi TaxID=77007 RepID=A0ABZ0SEZ1_9GAMM|nr:glycoside hydrolase family 57 [Thiorhodovibrio winogradskyi]
MIAHHALVLNLHQPAGNLEHLLDNQPWEAKEILFALDRMPRSLWGWEDFARVHLSLSGTLLETLSNPAFQSRVHGIVDCGKLLWHLQNQHLFEILGTGYYHPVLPLIPAADRDQHLRRWQGIARHLFWRPNFGGLWPPEMSFSQELIPLARRFGYRYVMIDSENVEPIDTMSWQELRYRPHIARQGEDEIIVVVRDRELSDAQESGLDLEWFLREVTERTKWCDFPPLITTASDGDNGGWFRNVTEGSNFWTAFYLPLLEQARTDQARIRPTFIEDYLNSHGARGEVRIRAAAWNTGWHNGQGFTQWTGSEAQRRTYSAYQDLSRRLQATHERLAMQLETPGVSEALETATWRLLRAETSCNTYWGEAWVERAEADLMAARAAIKEAESAAQNQPICHSDHSPETDQ